MNKLFQSMFPHSTVAKSFQLDADEINYMTNHGIAPYFKGLLIAPYFKGLHHLSFHRRFR